MKEFIILIICLPLLGYSFISCIVEYKRMKVKNESLLLSVVSYAILGASTLVFMIVNLFT